MAKSRKDKRGYALRTGESQRPNGTYSYAYTDSESHRHTVYAKTLAELRKKRKTDYQGHGRWSGSCGDRSYYIKHALRQLHQSEVRSEGYHEVQLRVYV